MTNNYKFSNIKVYGYIQKGISVYRVVRDGKSLTIKLKHKSLSEEEAKSLFLVFQMLDQASEFEYRLLLKQYPHVYLRWGYGKE